MKSGSSSDNEDSGVQQMQELKLDDLKSYKSEEEKKKDISRKLVRTKD